MSDVFSSEPLAEVITAETLVGEGKKYADANKLAEAYVHADTLIEQLKAEKARLEAEVRVRDELMQRKPNDDGHTRDEGRHNPPVNPDPNAERKEDVDLTSLVREQIEENDRIRKAQANAEAAANKMVEKYGSPEAANAAIHKRAQELDVSVEWLRDSAARSPAAFLASMGISDAPATGTPFSYSNDARRINGDGNKRNFKFFEEIRKTNPNRYYSREVQSSLFEARRELGDSFYN